MNSRSIYTIVVTITLAIVATLVFTSGRTQAQTVGATDLVVDRAYAVADFRACTLVNGKSATEWHFGGTDRSRRSQLTPKFDGRGRRIFRVVTNDSSLPFGHMRLRRVTEADPILEGFAYGTYIWEGIVVEYNGRVEGQRVVGPCGPAR